MLHWVDAHLLQDACKLALMQTGLRCVLQMVSVTKFWGVGNN